MDTELSRGAWLGSSLFLIIAVISIAVLIFGLARPTMGAIVYSIGGTITDENIKELKQLEGLNASLTEPTIVGLVTRNQGVFESCTIKGAIIAPVTPENVKAYFKTSVTPRTTYAVRVSKGNNNQWRISID